MINIHIVHKGLALKVMKTFQLLLKVSKKLLISSFILYSLP